MAKQILFSALISCCWVATAFSQMLCLGRSRAEVFEYINTLKKENPNAKDRDNTFGTTFTLTNAKFLSNVGTYTFSIRKESGQIDPHVDSIITIAELPSNECIQYGVDTLGGWRWDNTVDSILPQNYRSTIPLDLYYPNQVIGNGDSIFLDIYNFVVSVFGEPTRSYKEALRVVYIWDLLSTSCKSYFKLMKSDNYVQLLVSNCKHQNVH